MAQSTLNRLLIIPAIVLAATISLTGCANLPFFGGDSNSSNNSSNNKDDDDDEDEDEDEDDEDEKDEDDDDDNNASGGCPQAFLDSAKTESAVGDAGLDELTVSEIDGSDFDPAAIGDLLDGGCILTISYKAEGEEGLMYEAFIPGGDDLKAEIDDALVGDGWDDSSEGFYTQGDTYVIVTSNEDSFVTQEQIEEQGLDFLGDEFLVIVSYSA